MVETDPKPDLLVIRDWAAHFENNRTRELKRMPWVPISTDLNSDGYIALLQHRNGAAHFGVWIACVEVAANSHPRGTLTLSSGEPHDYQTLAAKTRMPEKLVCAALTRLEVVGWIARVRDGCEMPARCLPLQNRREQNKREEKRTGQEVVAVLEHYKTYHDKARPSVKDRDRVVARLDEGFTVADLCDAIDGNHRSPHHCGENDRGTKYHSLELIFRNSGKVQGFMEQPKVAPTEKASGQVRAFDNWNRAKDQQGAQG